jgi:hypothetical protein
MQGQSVRQQTRRNDHGKQTEPDQHAVQKQENEVVAPAPTEHLLLGMQGKQPLERHKHKKRYENNLEAKGIHRTPRLALVLSLFIDRIKSKPAASHQTG